MLNYKKSTFWITGMLIIVCVISAICFLTNPTIEYQIEVTIPAGSTADFCYSDEENCLKSDILTIENGEGIVDTEIILLPVEELNDVEETFEYSKEINTLENVTMIMVKYKSWEGDIEIINQSGSELSTGEWYSIERFEDGTWKRLDELIDGSWTDVAYHIPNGKTTVLPTNWKTWYGELSHGKYRIIKKVYVSLTERMDTYYLATEFEIK